MQHFTHERHNQESQKKKSPYAGEATDSSKLSHKRPAWLSSGGTGRLNSNRLSQRLFFKSDFLMGRGHGGGGIVFFGLRGVVIVVFVLIIAVIRIRQAAEFGHVDYRAQYFYSGGGQAFCGGFYKRHAGFAEVDYIHAAGYILTPKQGVAYGEHGRAVHYYAVVFLLGPAKEGAQARGVKQFGRVGRARAAGKQAQAFNVARLDKRQDIFHITAAGKKIAQALGV